MATCLTCAGRGRLSIQESPPQDCPGCNGVGTVAEDPRDKRIGVLQEACSYMYQYAGATDADVKVLDNLSALANDDALVHPWDWPAGSARFDELKEQARKLREHAEAMVETWETKTIWTPRAIDAISAYRADFPKEKP